MDELPHRAVVDLHPALGELRHQPAQGEVPLPAPLQQPVAPGRRRASSAGGRPSGPAPRCRSPGTAPPTRSPCSPRRRSAPPPVRHDSPPRTTASTTRSRRSIERGRAIHAGLLLPASMVNQINPKRGIPNRLRLAPSRSNRPGRALPVRAAGEGELRAAQADAGRDLRRPCPLRLPAVPGGRAAAAAAPRTGTAHRAPAPRQFPGRPKSPSSRPSPHRAPRVVRASAEAASARRCRPERPDGCASAGSGPRGCSGRQRRPRGGGTWRGR